MPGQTEMVTRYKLVAIDSSKHATENHDTEAAVEAAKVWFEKSTPSQQGAKYISITAEATIDANNPEPQPLYTEAELVRFGNYMVAKCIAMLGEPTPEQLQRIPVWDSDIRNWQAEELGNRKIVNAKEWNPRTEYPDSDRLVNCRPSHKENTPCFSARVRWQGGGLEWFNENDVPIKDAVQFEWTEINK